MMSAFPRFYPIVPDIEWLARLSPLGIAVAQLRMKGQPDPSVRLAIREALALAKFYRFQLIINDYWQLALEEEANFVHLGQEDLSTADISALRRHSVRLGISTHDRRELATALAAEPAYIALGPIYETKLKAMTWRPQGLERLTCWRRLVGSRPLIAIGGITPERADGVIEAGADSVSVITDFLAHTNPEQRVGEWIKWAARAKR